MIVCVDSRSAAVGQGAFLYEIVRKKREGLDLECTYRVGEADTWTCASLALWWKICSI